jgi:hypothetical protein
MRWTVKKLAKLNLADCADVDVVNDPGFDREDWA